MKFDNNNTATYTITVVNYVDNDTEKAEKLLIFDRE